MARSRKKLAFLQVIKSYLILHYYHMPYIAQSSFKSPLLHRCGHVQTIYASIFRELPNLHYQRERIITRDNDFLDLDWLRSDSANLVVLSHGLEGNSNRSYIKGMALVYKNAGWDVLAWNNRSCSGEMNLALKLYHHGDTEDLEDVVCHAIEKKYKNIVLVGFSMGGSQIIKYLGSKTGKIPEPIRGSIVFSVPFNLGDSARKLSDFGNTVYRKRFLEKLKNKMLLKHEQYPEHIDISEINSIKDFQQFDNTFTAPIFGFKHANDFYKSGSAFYYLQNINVPVLVVNAANDPMLPGSCYPIQESEKNKFVYLEIPKGGGHVGFYDGDKQIYWSERRALQFTSDTIMA